MRSFCCFLTLTLCLWAPARASSKPLRLEVKVLKAHSYNLNSHAMIPHDCNQEDFSAYCYGSKPVAVLENTMIIQESDGKSLEIACTAYNRRSHCVDLPVNQTFQAHMERHGLEIRYSDQNHQTHRQLYEILKENQGSH